MHLYTRISNKLTKLQEKPFVLEKELQTLFEENHTEISGLEIIKSEFEIKNKRIDTLAYDNKTNAFVIIEYKRIKNYSVIDQGITYLNLMLENKAEFIIAYNEYLNKNLKRKKINWSESLIIFAAPVFTENQLQAANFKNIPIRLWEVKRFENDVVMINEIVKPAENYKQSKNNIEKERINKESWSSDLLWVNIKKISR